MHTLREIVTYQPQELKFGTSGLRALAVEMTDLECYINTIGFLEFLVETGQARPGDVIYLAGDLRESTPRILRAVHQALRDAGYKTIYCGLIPTPAVLLYALSHHAPSIMVTGSHIPADRNGIKFAKCDGEVLKQDEPGIKAAVARIRERIYDQPAGKAIFTGEGMLKHEVDLPDSVPKARELYEDRYVHFFDGLGLHGKKIVLYEHSAVGRDIAYAIFKRLGATVIRVGRSDVFVPIDTENVTPLNVAYFKHLAAENPDAFAIVSMDGDSDRPFIVDESGQFHRGDEVGALVAHWLGADSAAFPISANDSVGIYLNEQQIAWESTRIGSPYVITAMQTAVRSGKQRVVGWEVNGGFMTQTDLEIHDRTLAALPTRDALLPILAILALALDNHTTVSAVFKALPRRSTDGGLIDSFPTEVSQRIVARFSADNDATRRELGSIFSPDEGFGTVVSLDTTDGVRIFFSNHDIAHLRPSGNAPQLRIYSVANSPERAREIVAMALTEPDGMLRRLEKLVREED